MDLRDTPAEAEFRSELRAWLDASLPEEKRGSRGGAQRFDDPFMREWSRKLYEAGYAGLGTIFGIPPEMSLAVSLLRRARDISIGVPILLIWQMVEVRRLREKAG